MIGAPQPDLLPMDIRKLVEKILNGEVIQYALCVNASDGSVYTAHNILDNDWDVFKMLGALTVLKDDVLAKHIRRDQEDED